MNQMDKEYYRPTTRGELKRCLEQNKICEVSEYVAQMTAIMLYGWLEFSAFSVEKSSNDGWVLFIPTIEKKIEFGEQCTS